MRHKPSKTTLFFAAATSAMGSVAQALGIDGSERRADSIAALSSLKSLMETLQANSALSLREKKSAFLTQAPQYIQRLTTTDLLDLFSLYQSDIDRAEYKYHFIYAEDTHKVVGWIKHAVFKQNTPIGNTHTHKKFMGMLKARALSNISRHNLGAGRSNEQNRAELNKLQILMEKTRGRVGNPLSWAGIGYEGEYKEWGIE